jgi:hypothetical protein
LDYAALAVNADDLGFYFLAFLQNVARVFNAVTARECLNVTGQFN